MTVLRPGVRTTCSCAYFASDGCCILALDLGNYLIWKERRLSPRVPVPCEKDTGQNQTLSAYENRVLDQPFGLHVPGISIMREFFLSTTGSRMSCEMIITRTGDVVGPLVN